MQHHLDAQHGQQLVEDVLARVEIVVERALRQISALRDARDRGIDIAVFAHGFGRRLEKRVPNFFGLLGTSLSDGVRAPHLRYSERKGKAACRSPVVLAAAPARRRRTG